MGLIEASVMKLDLSFIILENPMFWLNIFWYQNLGFIRLLDKITIPICIWENDVLGTLIL